MICRFIEAFKMAFGVYPICRALTGHGIAVSPRGYYARLSRPPSRRALRDAWLTGVLREIFEPVRAAGAGRSRCTGR